jgi:hypothetical protein
MTELFTDLIGYGELTLAWFFAFLMMWGTLLGLGFVLLLVIDIIANRRKDRRKSFTMCQGTLGLNSRGTSCSSATLTECTHCVKTRIRTPSTWQLGPKLKFWRIDMKASNVLRKAKQHLAMSEEDKQRSRGKYYYICWAIDEVERCPAYDRVRVKEYIGGLLGADATLEGWLEHTQKGFGNWWSQMTCEEYRTELQTTRLAWMDWMIQQYEAKGD